MRNGIELTFGNVLILPIGLGVTYWMACAPKSVLKLMSNRYPGIGLDTPPSWLVTLVRNFGRFVFLPCFTYRSFADIMNASLAWARTSSLTEAAGPGRRRHSC